MKSDIPTMWHGWLTSIQFLLVIFEYPKVFCFENHENCVVSAGELQGKPPTPPKKSTSKISSTISSVFPIYLGFGRNCCFVAVRKDLRSKKARYLGVLEYSKTALQSILTLKCLKGLLSYHHVSLNDKKKLVNTTQKSEFHYTTRKQSFSAKIWS